MFGAAQVLSREQEVTTLLASMVAMTTTAVRFRQDGDGLPIRWLAYTYVSRRLNPQVGFILGWAMFLEYHFQPVQNSLYAALTTQRLLPHAPLALLSAVAVGFMTLLCWLGIRTTARTNQILLAFMSVVMAVFLFAAFRYLLVHHIWHGVVSVQPLHDSCTFSVGAIAEGTALAATTYIGFHGVSILARRSP